MAEKFAPMPPFTADQIRYGRRDGDAAIYVVVLPADVGYDGQVRVTAARAAQDRTEEWIAEQLSLQATRLSVNVMYGRLYSPVDLPG